VQTKTYDIVIAGDFRLTGGTSAAIAAEIQTYTSAGLSIALLPLVASFFPQEQPTHKELRQLISDFAIPIVTKGGGPYSCSLLVLHNPVVLKNAPLDGFDIRSKHRVIVAHHVPLSPSGALNYNPWRIEASVQEAFGGPSIWAPTSPVCRERFRALAFDLPVLLSDWNNVIRVEDWGAPRDAPRFERISIGRHSRPDPDKWPDNRDDFFAAYPDAEDIDVHFLGAETFFKQKLGRIPDNWHLYPFGKVSPRAFLGMIDFFVYFHHPETIEAFGRAAIEAAAAGCVLILPHYLRPTFGPGSIYCEPADVRNVLQHLHADRTAFKRQSAAGYDHVRIHYGPKSLLQTCTAVMERPQIDMDMLNDAKSVAGSLRRLRTLSQHRLRSRWQSLGLGKPKTSASTRAPRSLLT
jgi:hypothetical protein